MDLNTHTHTHPFNGPLFGSTRVSPYQKGKTNLDFTGARDGEWQWHQLGDRQVCTSLQMDNHTSTSPLSWMPFLPPNQQCQSTEGTHTHTHTQYTCTQTHAPRPDRMLYLYHKVVSKNILHQNAHGAVKSPTDRDRCQRTMHHRYYNWISSYSAQMSIVYRCCLSLFSCFLYTLAYKNYTVQVHHAWISQWSWQGLPARKPLSGAVNYAHRM